MHRLALIIVATVLSALNVSAQEWVAGNDAISAIKGFFAAPQVWVYSPESETPVYVALSTEDRVRGSRLAVSAARESADEIFRCWTPHHGFSDSADGKGTRLLMCYTCRRAAFVKKGTMKWFTIGADTEDAMNALFGKYRLLGNTPSSNKTHRHEPRALHE